MLKKESEPGPRGTGTGREKAEERESREGE
jgi:hypothetical protein